MRSGPRDRSGWPCQDEDEAATKARKLGQAFLEAALERNAVKQFEQALITEPVVGSGRLHRHAGRGGGHIE